MRYLFLNVKEKAAVDRLPELHGDCLYACENLSQIVLSDRLKDILKQTAFSKNQFDLKQAIDEMPKHLEKSALVVWSNPTVDHAKHIRGLSRRIDISSGGHVMLNDMEKSFFITGRILSCDTKDNVLNQKDSLLLMAYIYEMWIKRESILVRSESNLRAQLSADYITHHKSDWFLTDEKIRFSCGQKILS